MVNDIHDKRKTINEMSKPTQIKTKVHQVLDILV